MCPRWVWAYKFLIEIQFAKALKHSLLVEEILTSILFEDPGWERLEKLKYRNFCHFRGCRVLHTLWPPFPLHSKYVNLAEDMKKAICKKNGW